MSIRTFPRLMPCWPTVRVLSPLVAATTLATLAMAQDTADELTERCNSGVEPSACHELGRMRARGEGGLPRDLLRALTYLEEACTGGVATACEDFEALNAMGDVVDRSAPAAHGLSGGALPGGPMERPPMEAEGEEPPPDMVRIEAGSFQMGSPDSEEGRDSDERLHSVTLARGFWLSMTEVTQSEYSALMGSNPSWFEECGDDCPVESVSWLDAVSYANERSRREGLDLCYTSTGELASGGTIHDCSGYRLPTEAEWEYSARAGGSASTYGPLESIAWYDDNSSERTHRVGQMHANAWGLYDMVGNVWEWTHDGYAPDRSGTTIDTVDDHLKVRDSDHTRVRD
jgi:formylglycine-generating enzyme required for sulfatase activity